MAVNIAMAANPIGLVIVGITALISVVVLLIKNWENIKTAIVKVGDAVVGAVKSMVDWIKNAFQSVINWIGGLVSGVINIGKNIVEGIWNGISGAYQGIKDKISGWVNGVLDWIKNVFGIHSPSSKTRDLIGVPMVQGIAEGITKNARLVDNAMACIMPDTKSTALALDVTRRFNDVAGEAMTVNRRTTTTTNLSEAALLRLESALVKAVQNQSGDVYLDSKKVGYAAAKYVSEAQGNAVTSLQRSGFRANVSAGLAY
jgi:phage-related protein